MTQNTPLNAPDVAQSIDDAYEKLKAISDQMRDAALCGHWDQLIILGQSYAQTFDALPAPSDLNLLPPEARIARTKLLIEILDNDVLIRELTLPEMTRVSGMMSRAAKSRTALRAYYEQNVTPSQL